jgi:hypothetical protein
VSTVPDTHTFEGGVATTSEANTFIRDPLKFILNPPIAELRQTSAQTFTTAVTAAVTFNAHDVDEDYTGGNAGHDDVTLNTRYTARYSGWYLISGAVAFAVNATGDRFSWLMVNGSDVNGSLGFTAADASAVAVTHCRTRKVFLNVGDYIELVGFQNSGGNLLSAVTGREQSSMSIHWVSN